MTAKTNSGKKKRQSKAATEQFNAAFKKKVEQFMADKDGPEKFPTSAQVALGIGLMPRGTPEPQQEYFVRQMRNVLKWAEQKDSRFHIWSNYVRHADVKGWRIVNADSDPIYIARHQVKRARALQTAQRKFSIAKEATSQYVLDHPDKAEVLENLIDEMMQTKIKVRA